MNASTEARTVALFMPGFFSHSLFLPQKEY